LEADYTQSPSRHLNGVELGQFATWQEVILGLTQTPEAHFYGVSLGHPLAK